ncbi:MULTISPECIES: hypothetical protein [unclassified Lentimonas]|uniref:hypothetical protein n=1 Tax=unclassified Lentimonas TaxID=2630993 RepID=UPI001324DD6A|nr:MULTISPECIES: hypothetical protein [unclassified Lentimonas]CAA6680157.1 Unannotated [Lentimonas sp. CC4]CAA6687470.1 Unannotated [Lentimonas sp. CC6]CAA7076201.1 Unannotated [Lentimonas sp. CC4]CAA7172128.1 Unannotated [Lentimonas sp. CC21]CAA7181797.1 Unannotated [Lentimonas sp. CC8]
MTNSIQLEELRELFIRYGCSSFHMARDGYSDEYDRIPPQKKKEWTDEYRADLLSRFESDPCDGHATSQFLHILGSDEEQLVDTLLNAIEVNQKRIDSLSKIIISERFRDHLQKRRIKHPGRKARMRDLGILLLESARGEPQSIAPRYKEMKYMTGKLDTAEIIERASKCLSTLEGMRTSRSEQCR